MSVVTAGSASAAHCVEGDSAGFSYFGTDHVQEADHAEGGNPGPHMGTSGASNCRETTGSPAERAPRSRLISQHHPHDRSGERRKGPDG